MERKLYILGLFVLLCWTFVLVQSVFPIIKSAPVRGGFNPAKNPVFSWKAWWDGTYQKEKNDYWNDHVGFHSDFVRINNQLDFSLFRKPHAKSIVIGKNWYLYEYGYVEAMAGKGFIGSVAMNHKIANLSVLRDSLAKHNIPVLVILAPNKARLYPEYLVDSMRVPAADSSNYNVCLAQLKKYNIPTIDVSDWFVKLKPTAKYPLFSPYGVHWSRYGVALVADSLTHYLQQIGLYTPSISYKIKYEKDKRVLTSKSDYDIGLGLNLIFPAPMDSMPYPVFEYRHDTTQQKISPIFLSDSFFWMFIYEKLTKGLFVENLEFWNYGKEVWIKGLYVRDLNIVASKPELYNHSALIIITSEVNLYNFGFGLLD